MKKEDIENKQGQKVEEDIELNTALWSDKIDENDPTIQAMQTLMYLYNFRFFFFLHYYFERYDDTPDEIALSFKEQG